MSAVRFTYTFTIVEPDNDADVQDVVRSKVSQVMYELAHHLEDGDTTNCRFVGTSLQMDEVPE
jgi:hypothetical protein